jgi:putative copper export protein
MISPNAESIRTALHLLAVAVWVGGQIVLAGIVPTMRREAPAALKILAQSFARIAWPAFIIAIATGMWSLAIEDPADRGGDYAATFGIKIIFVVIAGIATAVHSGGKSKLALALGGAVGLVASLIAFYLGVTLGHS